MTNGEGRSSASNEGTMRIAGVLIVAGLAAPALAAADALPLKRGMFVREGASCQEPSNSNAMSFGGRDLSTAHVEGKIVRVEKNGQNYVVTQRLEGDGGMGGNLRGLHKTALRIHSPTRFTVQDDGARTYRYCGPS